jgi:hypothetical protein
MVWINPGSKESLLELVNKTLGLELLYCLISFGGEIDFSSARSIVLCAAACVESREIKSSNVISLLKLHMLSAGNKITRSNVILCLQVIRRSSGMFHRTRTLNLMMLFIFWGSMSIGKMF